MPTNDGVSDEWRKSQILQHPLLDTTGSGSLWTIPVDDLYTDIARCVLLRRSAFIEETTGQGKSCAMQLVIDQLSRNLDGLVCIHFIAQTNRVPSVRAFFLEFLAALGHEHMSGETQKLRMRVRRKLEEVALSTANSVSVLWIDEAQAWTREEFLFLRDVQNGLRDIGRELVIFLSGEEPYLSRNMQDVSSTFSPAINRRFAMTRVRLGGYGKEELSDLFEQIDSAVWPESSGITWTQFFIPKAFQAGFRLRSEVDACMAALQKGNVLDREGLCQPWLIRDVLSRFFIDVTDIDVAGLSIAAENWTSAIQDSIGGGGADEGDTGEPT
ncbi:hypothetical protein OKW40_000677 [Paraburkholderia sp. RAU6.4a]|uniref:ATP-binding protein n=1 Tax=Paraburkholderia sp. RAU6.4a TaxID=2991067 RepID=UPI003D248B22